MVLCVAVAPYAFYTVALDHMDAGKASILCSCEPVAAMVFGICFFGEIPTVLSITGLIIVLAALAMLVLPEKKTHKKRAESQSLFFRFTGQYGRIELISERIKNVFLERIYEML